MTTSMPHHDRDRATARSATGLLATFNQAGVLSAADVHVATTLARLASEPDEHVALAAALASRAVRHGSVAVDLRTIATDAAPPPLEDADGDLELLPWLRNRGFGPELIEHYVLPMTSALWSAPRASTSAPTSTSCAMRTAR